MDFNDWLRILNFIQGKLRPLKTFENFGEKVFLRCICPELIEMDRWVGDGGEGEEGKTTFN